MSKEMTAKEAFQSLVEIYDITKSSKQCKIINKALNSVEETKTNYHTALAFCEASKEEKQELHKQIEQLEKENQELKEKISKFEKPILYMCRDRRSRELERLRLLELVNTYNVPILLNDFETVKELEKLKKVIDILKDKLNIRLHILTNTDGSKIYEIEFILGYYSTIYEITQQEFDLLKEMLENV